MYISKGRSGPVSRYAAPLLAAALLFSGPVPAAAQELPTPEQFLGFAVGTVHKLAHWDRIVEYMRLADTASGRIRTETLGRTTMGRDFVMVIATSAENMRNLDRIRGINRRLYDPDSIRDEAEAQRLVAEGKVVVCITLNIHSTEIGASQMALEAVYRLATEKSPYVQNILDNVVLLLIPSLNPDGQAMVVDWHNRTYGTEYGGSRMPWLYHYYTGHDNNRDAYMMTQAETRLLGKVLYHEWFPEVWLDEHQMGSRGARIFVMPASGPTNPNVDPWIYRTAGLLGFAQGQALDEAGKPGVVYGQTYTYWWQGAMAWTGWWHNMVGMLTEVASANLAAPIENTPAWSGGGGRGGAAQEGRVVWKPGQTGPQQNYLTPWPGGRWTLRDIVDYELIATYALLDASADMRENLLSGIYAVNRRTVEKGRAGDPAAIVVPSDQHDAPTLIKFLQVLYMGGVKVDRAEAPFTADGREYPAGTYVIPMAQVFRNYAKDLLEPQVYPSTDPPYDVTGWSLGMQMGVETIFVEKPFRYRGSSVGEAAMPAGRIEGRGEVILLDPRNNDSFTAALRLLRAGHRVARATGEVAAGTRTLPPGAFVVTGSGARGDAAAAVRELGLTAYAVPQAPDALPLARAPRVALYQAWGGNMDEGWSRYILDTFEWEPIVVHPEDIRDRTDLISKYDVILLPDGSRSQVVNGITDPRTPPEYRGGIGESGLAALRAFVEEGGTLVTLGRASLFAIEEFALPYSNRVDRSRLSREEFLSPGSLLEVQVDPTNPLAWGMPDRAIVMYANDPVLQTEASFDPQRSSIAVRFGGSNPLRSGWLRGPEHLYYAIGAATVRLGRGAVVLLPLRVQRRAQTHGTFKLLFNPLINSVSK